MNINDYLTYSAIVTKENNFYIIKINSIEQETCTEDEDKIEYFAKSLILDYAESMIFLKRPIKPNKIKFQDELLINMEYDFALKCMIRNIMYETTIRPSELASLLNISKQSVNNILNLKKKTNLDTLALCFKVLKRPLTIEA